MTGRPVMLRHFGEEIAGGADADGHDLGVGLLEVGLQPAGGGFGVFGIHQHVEMRGPHAGDVGRGARPSGRRRSRAMPMSASRRVSSTMSSRWRKPSAVGPIRLAVICVGAGHGFGQMADDLQERLIGAETFLALIAGQVQRDHRDAAGPWFRPDRRDRPESVRRCRTRRRSAPRVRNRSTASWQAVLNRVAVSAPRSRA